MMYLVSLPKRPKDFRLPWEWSTGNMICHVAASEGCTGSDRTGWESGSRSAYRCPKGGNVRRCNTRHLDWPLKLEPDRTLRTSFKLCTNIRMTKEGFDRESKGKRQTGRPRSRWENLASKDVTLKDGRPDEGTRE